MVAYAPLELGPLMLSGVLEYFFSDTTGSTTVASKICLTEIVSLR